MLFLESPSPLASVSTWLQWEKRLDKLKSNDETVIAEKNRARRIIAALISQEVVSDLPEHP